MTDERRDDEIIGRALSRAIETIDVNQTPFERSRIAAAPARRSIFGVWQLAGGVVAIVLAVAIGSWLAAPRDTLPGQVTASGTPSTTAASTASPAPTASPASTSAPSAVDHRVVYFARSDAAPIGVHVRGIAEQSTAADRITGRVTVITRNADLAKFPDADRVPPGAFNALRPAVMLGVGKVTVAGDLATVDVSVMNDDWGVRGAAQSLAALQQIVYTATEEPGIRRVLFTQNGGKRVTIDQLVVDKPLSREDVFGYRSAGAIGRDKALTWAGDDTIPHVVAKLTNVINDGTTTRLTFLGTGDNTETPTTLPSFSIALESNDDTQPVGGKTAAALNGGKYQLRVEFQWNGGGTSGGIAGTTVVDQTPLRAIIGANPTTLIELDDARPWRAWMPDKTHLVVEIGGDTRATSDRIAMTAPKPGDIANSGADLRVTGSARVFEANVSWRLLDSAGKDAASGHFNASLGSSALWGTFDARIQLPANVRGNLTLELFESSPKDGSAQGVVQVPLTVR